MQAYALVEGGVPLHQFWQMFPFQFSALVGAVNQRDQKNYFTGAMVCSVLAEIHRDPKQRSKPFQPVDFMPKIGEEKKLKKPSADDIVAGIAQLNKMFGGRDLRKVEGATATTQSQRLLEGP